MAKGKPLTKGKIVLVIVLTVILSVAAGAAFGIGYTASLRKTEQTAEAEDSFYSLKENGYSGSSSSQLLSNPVLSDKVAKATEKAQDSVVVLITTIMTEVTGFTGQSYVQENSAMGSGVLFKEDEEKVYILTNAHVIEDAETGYIYYTDGTEVPIYLVGESVPNDLAVVFAYKSDFPEEILNNLVIATLGDSDTLREGDLAIAIGTPYSQKLDHTTTVGVITGTGLHFVVDDAYYDLGTDAALNPGNSGGALINEDGEVIGINSAGIRDGVTEGMGYAVSINRAKTVIDGIFNGEAQGTATLGIESSVYYNEEKARWYHFPCTGEYLYELDPSGAAAAAGLVSGDMIIAINDQNIDSDTALAEILSTCEPGSDAKVEYFSMRTGQKTSLYITLGTEYGTNTNLPTEATN